MTQKQIELYRETLKERSEFEQQHGSVIRCSTYIKCLQIFNHVLSLPDQAPEHDIYDMSDAD